MSIKNLLTGPVSTKIIPAELLRPSFYGMLMVYYFAMALYGLTAIVFGVLPIANLNGNHFTLLWSILTCAVGVAAGIGVFVSRRLKKEWIEVVATSMVVGLLSGYGVAILTRALATEHWGSIAGSWLPFLICILPAWRLMMIALEGDLFKYRRKGN